MGSKRDGQGVTASRGSRSDPQLCRVVGMGVRKEREAGEAELQEQLQFYTCLLGTGFLMHPTTAGSQAYQWAWLHSACALEVTLAAVLDSRALFGPTRCQPLFL